MLVRLLSFLFIISSIQVLGQRSVLSYEILKKLEHSAVERSSAHIEILVKGDTSLIKENTRVLGGNYLFSCGGIASITLPSASIKKFSDYYFIQRMELNESPMQALSDSMVINNRIMPVHNGVSPLDRPYLGDGVIVGLIDTEIDYTHPDILDANGKTRIKWLWDPRLPKSTNTPQPFNAGQEFNNIDIDTGKAALHLNNVTHPHGTNVAGIMCGNAQATGKYMGILPKSDIIFVSWGSSRSSAVKYIFDKAAQMGKPCVINASLGSGGYHDGSDLESQLINALILQRNGQAFVTGSGNEGEHLIHLGYDVKQDTSFTWFVNVKKSNSMQAIQILSDTADFNKVKYCLGSDVLYPYSPRGKGKFRKAVESLNKFVYDTIYSKTGNRLGIVISYSELINKMYRVTINVKPDSVNNYWRLSTTGQGKFDIWYYYINDTPAMLFKNLPSSQQCPEISNYKYPDNTQTILGGFQCSPYVITVGNYVNRKTHYDYNGNFHVDNAVTPGMLTPNSSRGPTRDGRIKPDVSATGHYTWGACAPKMIPDFIQYAPHMVDLGGMHITNGGTSVSAPVVAGIVGLYLEKHPNAPLSEIMDVIKKTAFKDSWTGNSLPNSDWGHGKIDAYAIMIDDLITSTPGKLNYEVTIFPNPAETNELLTIGMAEDGGLYQLQLVNPLGQVVFSEKVSQSFKVPSVTPGLYLVKIERSGKVYNSKLLIN